MAGDCGKMLDVYRGEFANTNIAGDRWRQRHDAVMQVVKSQLLAANKRSVRCGAARDGAPSHAGARPQCMQARTASRDQSTAAEADHDEGRHAIGSTDHTAGLNATISGEIAADAGC